MDVNWAGVLIARKQSEYRLKSPMLPSAAAIPVLDVCLEHDFSP